MKLQALLGLCAHSICASGDIVDNAYTVLVYEQ
jgi:hypothetical protein